MHRFILVIIAMLLCSTLHASDKGLVADWDFSPGSGNVLKNKVGSVGDGKIFGAKWVKIKGISALNFDGVSGYADCGTSNLFDLSQNTFSIEVWALSESTPGEQGIVGKSFDSYAVTAYQGSFFAYLGAGANYIEGNPGPPPLQWHHLVYYYDNGKFGLYTDGKLARASSYSKTINVPEAPFLIGSTFPNKNITDPLSTAALRFKGYIASVKFYNRVLESAEIAENFYASAQKYGNEKVVWFMPAKKDYGISTSKINLAALKNTSYVITSSNADTSSLYSNNLIDNDVNTTWRSFRKSLSEYAELKWKLNMQVNQLRVIENEASNVARYELYAWVEDNWKKIASKSAVSRDITLDFPVVDTNKLKLVMYNKKPDYIGLREIIAYGPDQPLVRIDPNIRWVYAPVFIMPSQGNTESLSIWDVKINPANPKPGSYFDVSFKMKSFKKLLGNYALVLTIGNREKYFLRQDFTSARYVIRLDKSLKDIPENQEIIVKKKLWLPVYAANGDSKVFIHGISQNGYPNLQITDSKSDVYADGIVSDVNINRYAQNRKADPVQSSAIVDTTNGTLLNINGKLTPPIMFALQTPSLDRFHYYTNEAGVKIYHLQIYPFRIDAGDYQKRNYEYVEDSIRNLVKIDPDAYVIIEMDMRSSATWQEANPGGCLYTWDGKKMHESFVSKEYVTEGKSYVGNLVKFVQSKGLGGRVIGYLVELGEPEGVLSGGPDIGDYNPQAIEAFREFVREKYVTLDALRKAYNDPNITFETVYPDHNKIMETGKDGGCFLDPATQKLTIDYHEFVSSMVPNFLLDCAKTIKDLTNGKALVGSYWAYMLEDICYGQQTHQANHSYLHHVLASPYIDFFAAPFNYWHPARYAGDPYLVFQPYDSLRVNGKIHIPECDHRTFRAGELDRSRNRSKDETLAVMRRDIATALMHGMGAWFSDWTNNESADPRLTEPYFLEDGILKQVNSLRNVYDKTKTLPKKKTQAEVAVFASGTSVYFHDNNSMPIYTDAVRTTLYYNINMMGAPYDQLIFEDIMKPEVQDGYKCYIFLNTFYMNDAQRAVIEKLKRDGKTLVWLYAPGYASDTQISTDNIKAITGFNVDVENIKSALAWKLAKTDKSVILDEVKDEIYGGQSGAVSPRFNIDDTPGAVKLGVYEDGKTALAAKDFGSYKSVYCAVPYLPISAIRGILKYAGVNIYVDEEIYIDATNDFLMLTNSFEKERNLKVTLPEKKDVCDMESDKLLFKSVNSFKTKIKPGTTLLYRLK